MRLDYFHKSARLFYNSRRLPLRSNSSGLAAACVTALSALACAGCSISMPMSPLVTHSNEDVTGSISQPLFPELLNAEDRRRAKAAMTTALDPQGAGSTVAWDNPDSGVKGSFLPIGKAYPENDLICRAFVAELALKTGDRSIQGKACANKDGNWMVTDAAPWKKS